MAIHTHRTVTTTRQEWLVPANPRGHIQIGDFSRAYDAAMAGYRAETGTDPHTFPADDALQVAGQEDGSVVISFESRSALAAAGQWEPSGDDLCRKCGHRREIHNGPPRIGESRTGCAGVAWSECDASCAAFSEPLPNGVAQ